MHLSQEFTEANRDALWRTPAAVLKAAEPDPFDGMSPEEIDEYVRKQAAAGGSTT